MMNNEELHQRTTQALLKAWDGHMEDEDLSLLCWHCGIPYQDIKDIYSKGNPAPVSPVFCKEH